MTYFAFVDELARRANSSREKLLEKPTFPLNTNKRGLKLVRTLEAAGVKFEGKNVLDVGCAYGGMSIEPARKGANVIGVDVMPMLLDLARLNAQDEVDVEFRQCDASSYEIEEHVPQGWADIIVINDVLEHIYDTASLMKNMARLARQGAMLYYVVPNGWSTRFVQSEGHKKIFAISVIDPDCWHYFLEGRPRIFYRRWAYFESLMSYYGFAAYSDLTAYAVDNAGLRDFLTGEIEALTAKLDSAEFNSDEAAQIAREEVTKYISRLKVDMDREPNQELRRTYAADFWSGLRRKN